MKTPLATFFALLMCGAMLKTPSARSQQPVDPPKARAEIAEFFEQYKSATADPTGEKLTSLYDFDTMTREIVAQAGVELPEFARQGMATALSHQISQKFQLFGGAWYRHKVVSIHFFGAGDQAEVYVRSWNEHQETSREIFWLRRENDEWRISDFMDLSTSLACTKLAALGLKQGLRGEVSATSLDTLRLLMSAVVLIGQDDLDGGSEAMEHLMGRPVPIFAESIRWSFAAAVALMDDATRSLEYLDKATAFQPDLPLAEYMRAVAYNQPGRHEQAAASARQFMMRFGDDADAYQELAVPLVAMDKPEEAVVELRKALADTPNSLLNVEQLGLLLPVDQKHELGAYFQSLQDHSDSFQYLADSFEMQEDGDALEVLVKSMESINAQEPLLDYYRIAVMSTRGQYAQAWDLASQVLQSIDQENENRDLYEWMHQVQAIYADKLLESYETAGDPQSFARVAFAEVIELDQRRHHVAEGVTHEFESTFRRGECRDRLHDGRRGTSDP